MRSPPGPLSRATAEHDFETVKDLLESGGQDGIPQNIHPDDSVGAMRIAVEENELMIVDLFLANGMKPTGWDFISAVKQRSYSMLELLLLGGYDVNACVRDDWPPPLADALFDAELVRWLIEHGADPNARCRYDITPLSVAAGSASREVIELLFELGASVQYGQPLHCAVRANREDDIVELLLEKGASPNAVMFQDHPVSFCQFECLGLGTPLHEAARQKNDRLMQLLLKHGANPQIRNTFGEFAQVRRLPFDTAL
ncbi:hypothetical protein PV04_09152 [Phialophora macrospora]|uniref:Uncharacterized protein n=1 Tax=Phialophora macrospora TaxID=1851006 RepID=A0A0D2FW31_9EURO|nr:hypothetical protein PV04_09152 [Phialophora macrospora]